MNAISNHVPHAEPLRNGEGPANWVAGWNMPGYLPEMEPAFFENFDDAKRFVLNALGDAEEDAAIDDEDLAETISALRQDLNLKNDEFSKQCDGLAYWVEECNAAR